MLLLAPPIISPDPVFEEPVAQEPVETEKPGKDEAPTHVLIIQGDAETLRKLMLAYGGTLAAIENVTVE